MKYLVVACLALFSLGGQRLSAQQDPLFSQYMFNKLTVNPGFAGSTKTLNGTLAYRQQFAGLKGAPQVQMLAIHAPLKKKSMGLGVKVVHESIGVTSHNQVAAIYSYHLGLSKGKLSFGLEGGVLNQSIDFSNLQRTVLVDNVLPAGKESVLVPDAAFGLYYYSEKLYLGGAVYHLLQNEINFSGNSGAGRAVVAEVSSHAYFIGGYSFNSSENLRVEPSLLLKYVGGTPLQVDINVNVRIKEMIAIGGTFRTGDALIFLFQYNFKDRFKFGYSYDYMISDLAVYTNGFHGITLGYTLPSRVEPPEIEEYDDTVGEFDIPIAALDTPVVALDIPIVESADSTAEPDEPIEVVTDSIGEQPGMSPIKAGEIVYKVQILSSEDPVYITPNNFNGLENIEEYLDEGLYNYLLPGSAFYDYANSVLLTQARNHGYEDAFIVAFKGGEQVSVEETLKIPEVAKMPSSVESSGANKLGGRVTSQGGVGVQGVSVKLFSEDVEFMEEMITTESGEYAFNVSPGKEYSLYFTKPGYFDRFQNVKSDDSSIGIITLDVEMVRK